ncbi:GntR family transcriptional regulator [Herbiconiux sp. P18]|uniref:GntR family transcriptional regulator n=1 Tax=Herbiconiux liangxiaofengii TaxID=3342795 RepID=UPI0035B6E450
MPVPSADAVRARTLLRDDVYVTLRDAIVDGTLQPGERLRDPELERWLGVSRTPIREALLRLERSGLVIARPGRATTVAPAEGPEVQNAQQVAAALHELAARLAVPQLVPAELDALRGANDDFRSALDAVDVDAALEADDRFHGVFVAASGNAMIAEVLEGATAVLRRVERIRFSSLDGRDSVRQHEGILEAARAGDAEAAALRTRENWMSLPL